VLFEYQQKTKQNAYKVCDVKSPDNTLDISIREIRNLHLNLKCLMSYLECHRLF